MGVDVHGCLPLYDSSLPVSHSLPWRQDPQAIKRVHRGTVRGCPIAGPDLILCLQSLSTTLLLMFSIWLSLIDGWERCSTAEYRNVVLNRALKILPCTHTPILFCSSLVLSFFSFSKSFCHSLSIAVCRAEEAFSPGYIFSTVCDVLARTESQKQGMPTKPKRSLLCLHFATRENDITIPHGPLFLLFQSFNAPMLLLWILQPHKIFSNQT